MPACYNYDEIVDALIAVGVKSGDTLFTHSNVGFLGKLDGANSTTDYYNIFKKAIFSIIGTSGTWIVPTFSLSFCRGEEYDPVNTPTFCGLLSEEMRKDEESVRSNDANFSVCALGAKAFELTQNVSDFSFGEDSFFDRFYKCDGDIVNINFDTGSTFIHYVERCLQVPYRYDKCFSGTSIINGEKVSRNYYHFCHDLGIEEHVAEFSEFDCIAKESGVVTSAILGRGIVAKISAEDTYRTIEDTLKYNPSLLIRGNAK